MGKDLKKKRKRKFQGNRYTVAYDARKSKADDKDSKCQLIVPVKEN